MLTLVPVMPSDDDVKLTGPTTVGVEVTGTIDFHNQEPQYRKLLSPDGTVSVFPWGPCGPFGFSNGDTFTVHLVNHVHTQFPIACGYTDGVHSTISYRFDVSPNGYLTNDRPLMPGDMNGDGAVNGQDIDGFVLALFHPAGYGAQ